MELFIDDADIDNIKRFSDIGVFRGITTTPTFFARLGIKDYLSEIKKISKLMNGAVHIEAMGKDEAEIMENAKKNKTCGKNIVSKIPVSMHGIKAVTKLKKLNIQTNVHLIFSLNQAILAAEAGADYICPLMGRINDIGGDACNVLKEIVTVVKGYGYPSKIMASSIRSPEDVSKALMIGVDAITIPSAVINMMFFHPLTNIGVNMFKKDLLLSSKVKHLMRSNGDMPFLKVNAPLYEALSVMTEKRIGLGIVTNGKHELLGILTDGDVRRILKKSRDSINSQVGIVMNKKPVTIDEELTANEALQMMERKRITSLVVLNKNQAVTGYMNLHDLLDKINI